MMKRDWQDAGDQIRRIVEDAVNSKDFSDLSDTISDIVNDTVNGLQSIMQESLKNGYHRDNREYTNRDAADRIRREMEERKAAAKEKKNVPAVFSVPGEISGRVMKWTGYSFGGVLGLSTAILGGIWAISGVAPLAIPTCILGALGAVSVGIGWNGAKKLELAKRFRRYKAILGERTYCLIEELAGAVGRKASEVTKDLKKMIETGLFQEGYLNGNETILITDRSTYEQYLATQTEYERRRSMDAQEATQQEAAHAKLSPECREIIETGQKYIQHIHECNVRIPGEEITAKLNRLELVITRIFKETEKNPSASGELKKLMNYYLPTTIKLLDAYCEMDAQPVVGQNIENTKKEIENALDTINGAFENLLDSLFQDEAWDISSDISVLNTMLAQEGLTGQTFNG